MEDVAPDYRSGVSSSLGHIRIVSEVEFIKLKSGGMKGWVKFVAAAVVAITLMLSFLFRGRKIEKKTSPKHK